MTRPWVGVIGSAQGVVEEGDIAFEINHPGGYCCQVCGTAVVAAAVARATSGVWTLRLGPGQAGYPTATPTSITVTSSAGGTATATVTR